jgi:hypothetical protein
METERERSRAALQGRPVREEASRLLSPSRLEVAGGEVEEGGPVEAGGVAEAVLAEAGTPTFNRRDQSGRVSISMGYGWRSGCSLISQEVISQTAKSHADSLWLRPGQAFDSVFRKRCGKAGLLIRHRTNAFCFPIHSAKNAE